MCLRLENGADLAAFHADGCQQIFMKIFAAVRPRSNAARTSSALRIDILPLSRLRMVADKTPDFSRGFRASSRAMRGRVFALLAGRLICLGADDLVGVHDKTALLALAHMGL